MCVILARKKPFKYFSSPFALFPANLHVPRFCFAIWGCTSHTFGYNSLNVAKSELFLLPSAEQPCLCALSQTHKWHTLAFCPPWSPEKEKTLRERMATRSVSNAPFLQHSNLQWRWAGTLLGDEAISCTSSCLSKHGWGHPPMKHTLVKYCGSNSELMQGMAPGQRLQSLFCIISGFKYYTVLPCQDIYSVLETGNKKIFWLLAGGFAHICSSLI